MSNHRASKTLATCIDKLLRAGALIYFSCHIFHDWPDETCRQVLAKTTAALAPSCFRIVTINQILPDVGASAFWALMDLSMMYFGGMERTQRQWHDLLEGMGLNVTRMEVQALAASDAMESWRLCM